MTLSRSHSAKFVIIDTCNHYYKIVYNWHPSCCDSFLSKRIPTIRLEIAFIEWTVLPATATPRPCREESDGHRSESSTEPSPGAGGVDLLAPDGFSPPARSHQFLQSLQPTDDLWNPWSFELTAHNAPLDSNSKDSIPLTARMPSPITVRRLPWPLTRRGISWPDNNSLANRKPHS